MGRLHILRESAYEGRMTKLLEDAIKAAEALPAEVQDELAAGILKLAKTAKDRPLTDATSVQDMLDDSRTFSRTLRFMADYAETFKALAK